MYPHTLETHALSTLPAAIQTIESSKLSRKQFLLDREERIVARKKAELNKVAPGWTGEGGVMLPLKKSTSQVGITIATKVATVPTVQEGMSEDALSSLVGLQLE